MVDATWQLVLAVMFYLIPYSDSSLGDRSKFFQRCSNFCYKKNCTGTNQDEFLLLQPLHLSLLGWDCPSECDYDCMWKTVELYQKQGRKTPQFFGKWPFVRLLGMQEPASVLFSALNLMAHLVMMKKFKEQVNSDAPNYNLWRIYSWVCVMTWLGAVAFHTRDTPVTEKIDYFGAFSMVLFSLYALVVRCIGTQRTDVHGVITVGFLSFYFYHIYYLWFVHFDYGYNMQVNVAVGALNAIGWLMWCFFHRLSYPYIWQCVVTVVILVSTTLLELLDFPPYYWLFDAHSLWHLSTAVIPFVWYRFIINDCNELKKKIA